MGDLPSLSISSLFLRFQQSATEITSLIVVLVLLHKFLGVEIPQEDFTVVRSREQPPSVLCIVNGPHVIFVVMESAESSLPKSLLIVPSLLPEIVVAVFVAFVRLVAPDSDRGVVRTRDQRVHLG